MTLRIRVRLPVGSPLLEHLDRVSTSVRVRRAALLWAVNRCATFDAVAIDPRAYVKPISDGDPLVDLYVHADEPAYVPLQNCSVRFRSALAAAMAEVGLQDVQTVTAPAGPGSVVTSRRLDGAPPLDPAAKVFEELGPLRFGDMEGT